LVKSPLWRDLGEIELWQIAGSILLYLAFVYRLLGDAGLGA
jgi:hypothetical protein